MDGEDYQSPYGTVVTVLLAFVIISIIIVVVFGNILVIVAVAKYKSLKSVQNLMIVSLALADLSIGLRIMPFSLARQLVGYWVFGTLWCDIHGALDVFLCTSSILHICMISLDRYCSIIRPIQYINKQTSRIAMLYIAAVWIFSAVVSIPPLLGWKKTPNNDWFYTIMEGNSGNLTLHQFVDQLHHKIGDEQFRHFMQVLEDTGRPKCQVRLISCNQYCPTYLLIYS